MDLKHNKIVTEFVSLLTDHQGQLYSYILSLIPNFNDADDILQDTTKIMWEKFGEYKSGTDFLAWGRKIAYYNVLEYFRRKKKENGLCFDEQLADKLSINSEKVSDSSKEYVYHLNSCIDKLNDKDQELLKHRYFENSDVKSMAAKFGCSVQYVYRNISRVQQLLLVCIEKQLL